MSIVRGENAILYTFHDSVWKMGACFKSISLSLSTTMIETTVSGNGSFASFAPQKHSFTGSADGIVSLNKLGMLGLPDFRNLQIAKTMLLMRFQRTDRDGNLYTDECRFYITNSTDNSSFDNLALFRLELQGTGGITQVFTPTATLNTNPTMRYEYTGIGTETGFTDPALIGKYIEIVHKNGSGNGKLITSGTPVGLEVKYTSATGAFEWAIPFEVGEIAVITYRDI